MPTNSLTDDMRIVVDQHGDCSAAREKMHFFATTFSRAAEQSRLLDDIPWASPDVVQKKTTFFENVALLFVNIEWTDILNNLCNASWSTTGSAPLCSD